jgi:hypothetical protein
VKVKTLIFLLSSFLLESCIPKEEAKTIGSDTNFRIETEKPFSNPAIIYGSSFGVFFQSLYKLGKFEEMILFTASESIEKYGEDSLLSTYKNMNFGFKMKLLNINNIEEKYILNYQAEIEATNRMIRMECVVENDSCKIVINDGLVFF